MPLQLSATSKNATASLAAAAALLVSTGVAGELRGALGPRACPQLGRRFGCCGGGESTRRCPARRRCMYWRRGWGWGLEVGWFHRQRLFSVPQALEEHRHVRGDWPAAAVGQRTGNHGEPPVQPAVGPKANELHARALAELDTGRIRSRGRSSRSDRHGLVMIKRCPQRFRGYGIAGRHFAPPQSTRT